MQYKTIVLELLQEHPEIYDQLLASRTLLPTLNRCACQLRDNHQQWKTSLSRAKPGSDETQIASVALEMAIQELQDQLQSAASPDESQPLTLDAAMAFLHRPTSPA